MIYIDDSEKARVWSFKASWGDKREQVQKEKDPSDFLRGGGRKKTERTDAQEEGITKMKEDPDTLSG